ncbi:MAG: tRNA (adenosine(37)-N6)-dimethylallyltransferase MiaA [Clostridia bacterium]|nr:tRNA (adenosine(37)-N6)-dimethylallyltransferase MiaA [Clostridia bacterium]
MIFALAITGPTASGKTALSLGVAKRLSAEIISCDSMQIYKEMNIGTAKATVAERTLVPHHMIDFLSPTESYSVEEYRAGAIACAREITGRGKLPLFVGGTGLYIDSVGRCNAQDAPESDPEYRERILAELKSEEDVTVLWERLREVDPESAEKIHKNNVRRVIRALEIYDKTGKPKSQLDRESLIGEREVFVGMITIDFRDRELLYRRIDKRVDIMIEDGLLSEVESLYRRGLISSGTASAAIGYKEIIEYLDGRCSLEEAVELLKLNSRRYAKRQLTWFRHEREARIIYADKPDGSMKSADEMIEEALVIEREMRLKYEKMKGNGNDEG